MNNYLSQDILLGFNKYKYSSKDTSPLSNYVMHPFWNWMVQFFPFWVAPNLLTFSGFLFLILQFILLSFYDFHFYASDDTRPEFPKVPNILFLIASVLTFVSHQLDGMDGKQARRTNSSSPLGELFDHGVDSLATLFMPIGLYTVFGRGPDSVQPLRVFYVLLSVMAMFICSHWEKYNTGVLYLPWGYDISQLAVVGVYLITYFCGYSLWKKTFFDISSSTIIEIIMHFSVWGFGIPVSLWNIYQAYKNGTGHNLSLYENLRPLVPICLCFFFFLWWAIWSPNQIIDLQPRLFCTACAFIFSNITCRCIVNCMSQTRCEVFNWLLVPLALGVLSALYANVGYNAELSLLILLLLISAVAHLHYGIHVVQELAAHLNIYVFSIRKKKKVPTATLR